MSTKKEQYYEGVGRRKTSVSRVRLIKVDKNKEAVITVNDRSVEEFFNTVELRSAVLAPLEATSFQKEFKITIKVKGGGQRGQAEATQLGLSRALVKYNGDVQKTLRDLDYLKRDPRQKERKKPGLKKARKSPQWSKR